MRTTRQGVPRAGLALAFLAVVCLLFGSVGVAPARAGTWTLVSCHLPDGQPAPIDGWSTSVYGGPNASGSGDIDGCASGGALTAVSATTGQPQSYTGPMWVFTAPADQTIAGGTVTASLTSPQGQTWIGTPGYGYDSADVIVNCQLNAPCGSNGVYSGTFPIDHPGGTTMYAPALCVDFSQSTCPLVGGGKVNAEIDIAAADIELTSSALPVGQDFSGPLLDRGARGTADLLFTASDPAGGSVSGPGVYSVTVEVDGRVVYAGTPNTNSGACAPVGTEPAGGGLMFDHIQPCPTIESVDVPVNTRPFADGSHDLQVLVTDAAGNTATVLDRTITTHNPHTTPLPRGRGRVRTQLVVSWRWRGAQTTIEAISARRLSSRAMLTVSCRGRRCPRLKHHRVSARDAPTLWHELTHRRFTAGDRLFVTIAQPPLRSERLAITIRDGRVPRAAVS